jgi:hypothetical protein
VGEDGRFVYVASEGDDSIHLVDVDKGFVVESVAMPRHDSAGNWIPMAGNHQKKSKYSSCSQAVVSSEAGSMLFSAANFSKRAISVCFSVT